MRRWATAAMSAATAVVFATSSRAEDCGFRTPPDISVERELMITDLTVVNDERAETANGAWSFPALMGEVARRRTDTGPLIRDWLRRFDESSTVNGFPLTPRPAVATALTHPWMTRDGATSADRWRPDPAHAPFRLLAIVYRPDLGVIGPDGAIASAGEARFVFTALDLSHGATIASARPLPFTVILEYTLPARDRDQVRQWAERWHALGHLPFGPRFNAALQDITDRFTRGGAPLRLRTDDGLATPWQFREFHVDGATARFVSAPVTSTPDLSLIDHAADLSAQLNAHPGDDIPARFSGGSSDIPDAAFRWPQMALANDVLRHNFAMQTCNGCHGAESGRKADGSGGDYGGTGFRHLGGRLHDERATLSEFLTGNPAVVADPSGKLQTFCDLKLRQLALFEALHADAASSHDLAVARARRERTD